MTADVACAPCAYLALLAAAGMTLAGFARGGRTPPSVQGQRAIESTEGPSPPLTRRFEAPGDAYFATVVFDLPEGEREPRLLLTSGEWETRLLIGHENSFFHRKTLFRLS